MRMRSTRAAALAAAGALGLLQAMPAGACSHESCGKATLVAQGKPLQLMDRQAPPRPSVRKPQRNPAPATTGMAAEDAAKIAAEEPLSAGAAADNSATAPVPIRVVRTTREPGDESATAGPSFSLVMSTITNYLGGPAMIEPSDETAQIGIDNFPADAKEAFAAEYPPQEPAAVSLEYILMTFGGALAAAAAIRVFVV